MDATQTLEESTVQNHLIRRGTRYYFRRRIPADLLLHFNPSGEITKKELTKSLGTSDRREAERLARAMAVHYDDQFQAIRSACSSVFLDEPKSSSPEFDVRTIDLGEGTLSAEETNRQVQDESVPESVIATEAAYQLERLKREIAQHRLLGSLQDFMTMERLRFVTNRAALEGREELHLPTWKLRATVLAQQEIFEPGQHPPVKWLNKTPQAASTPTAAPAANPADATTLSKLLDYWRSDRNPTNARTILKADLVIRRFRESQGDLWLHEITRKC